MTKDEMGQVLKSARNTAGLSPADVAERLKQYGIELSEKTLYGYENGHSSPQIVTLFRLCEIYGIDDVSAAFGFAQKNPAAEKDNDLAPSVEKGGIKRILMRVKGFCPLALRVTMVQTAMEQGIT